MPEIPFLFIYGIEVVGPCLGGLNLDITIKSIVRDWLGLGIVLNTAEPQNNAPSNYRTPKQCYVPVSEVIGEGGIG